MHQHEASGFTYEHCECTHSARQRSVCIQVPCTCTEDLHERTRQHGVCTLVLQVVKPFVHLLRVSTSQRASMEHMFANCEPAMNQTRASTWHAIVHLLVAIYLSAKARASMWLARLFPVSAKVRASMGRAACTLVSCERQSGRQHEACHCALAAPKCAPACPAKVRASMGLPLLARVHEHQSARQHVPLNMSRCICMPAEHASTWHPSVQYCTPAYRRPVRSIARMYHIYHSCVRLAM